VISDNFEENENAQFLKSIPGIGQFFAMLIDAEIGEVSRFRDAKKLASYIGIVPSTYSSGGKTVNGRITRQGSKLLRWAFIEAVLPAIRSNEELRFEYDELRKRMNYNKAKVAMARKIMNIAFKCLKDKRNFRKLNKIELERKKFRSVS
jgi:transposase